MGKRNLLDDIVQNPARIYRAPGDVLRDRRFGDADRLVILRAWQVRQDGDEQIAALIVELEQRLAAHNHAAE